MIKISNIRTDLALEAHEMNGNKTEEGIFEVPGVNFETIKKDKITVTKVIIESDEGEKALGKPVGNYITIEAPGLRQKDEIVYEQTIEAMQDQLGKIVNLNKDDNVLVVGLGNWNITPDALGPKVVSNMMITRHLKEYIPDKIDERIRPVCALAPGVLGITGIETSEIIKGVVDKIKPKVIIAIDALASRRVDRVSTTIQISDTGINPGSGVGNKRLGLNKDTLGVPVIAIGVPTVVDAATIANDTIDLIVDAMINQSSSDATFYKTLKDMQEKEKLDLIRSVLNPYVGNLLVTPKDVDVIIQDVSKIVADGINLVLQKDIDKEDIEMFRQLQ